jgi:cellulose synthase (UDP-forming)
MPSELLLIVIGWNLINTGLAGAALGVVSERRERRRNQRLNVHRHALLHIHDTAQAVIVKDVSSGGLSVEFIDGVPPKGVTTGQKAVIELRRNGRTLSGEVVCRTTRGNQSDPSFGFAFSERSPETFVMIAEIMYSDQSCLQDRLVRRQKPLGFFTGTVQFSYWMLRESLRAFVYAFGLVRETSETSHPDAELVLSPFPQIGSSSGAGHDGFAAIKELNCA